MKATTILCAASVALLFACQAPLPVSDLPSGGKSLTVSWRIDGPDSRTLLPTNLPTPQTYDVSLTPTMGTPTTRTGVTEATWTFRNIKSVEHLIEVTGYGASGEVLVKGSSTVDMSQEATSAVSIPLNYIFTGSGSGQVHLAITSTKVATSATVQLMDPSGNVSSSTLVGTTGLQYTYENLTAAPGNYRLLVTLKTATQTALRMESLLVALNVDTVAAIAFTDEDFNGTYVPVTSLSLPATASVAHGGTSTLSASFAPTTSSNTLVKWVSDKPSVATVDSSGKVTGVTLGTATITATSVDNPQATATCTVTVRTLAVLYDPSGADGGSVPVDATEYAVGRSVTVLGNTGALVRSGYVFGGWTTLPNGQGTSYTAGATFLMGSGDTTLYAHWLAGSSITFDANGGTGSPPVTENLLEGSSFTVPGNTTSMTKTNYAFTGWNTKSNWTGTTYAPGATITMGTSPILLYAMWNTIVYDGNGATGGVVPVDTFSYTTAAVSISVQGNPGTLVRSGYKFSGWNTKADGTGTTYQSGATYSKPAGPVTLYARWLPSYTVTYVANGATSGAVPVDGDTYLNAATVTVLGNTGTLAKTNAVFTGWNTKDDRTGTAYSAGATFTMTTANVTLYAQWTPMVDKVFSPSSHPVLATLDGDYYANGQYFNADGTAVSLSKFTKISLGVSGVQAGFTQTYSVTNQYTYPFDLFLTTDGGLWGVGYLASFWGGGSGSNLPLTQVANGVTSVASTSDFTMIVRHDGKLWGSGQFSSMLSSTGGANSFVPLEEGVAKVWAGGVTNSMNSGQRSAIIQKTDGTLWATGYNANGNLGLGDTTARTAFTLIPGMSGNDVKDVVLFLDGDATLILKNDGTIWAAGHNSYGQFGTGTKTSTAQTTFVQLSALGSDNAAIAAGLNCTMILKSNGDLYVAGSNSYGQLGDGTNVDRPSPVQILSGVKSATMGYEQGGSWNIYAYAVKTDGTLWRWTSMGSTSGKTPAQVIF